MEARLVAENMHDIKGYVYNPPEAGLPYVGLVVVPGHETIVRLYETESEAKADVDLEVVRMKQATIAQGRE